MASQLINTITRRSSLLYSGFYRSARAFCTPTETPQPRTSDTKSQSKATHKVDALERKMLVWTGKYKNADEVPGHVSQDVMERTRNKIRIRVANIMMVLTALACVAMVWSGKNAASRGESVQKMNLDWHKEYNEKSLAEAKAKSNN
ncbi:CLUMA_CG005021, isoform A [Clunio marinus]|uniref:CLUMA_CG005021, isoform A n=1 Tax=Clunio marinus TaxID=568069 RepID=A0A1J1HVG6_9DIPT|nr:CLUMA_CG005021, isoform A [Clunio marinus]